MSEPSPDRAHSAAARMKRRRVANACVFCDTDTGFDNVFAIGKKKFHLSCLLNDASALPGVCDDMELLERQSASLLSRFENRDADVRIDLGDLRRMIIHPSENAPKSAICLVYARLIISSRYRFISHSLSPRTHPLAHPIMCQKCLCDANTLRIFPVCGAAAHPIACTTCHAQTTTVYDFSVMDGLLIRGNPETVVVEKAVFLDAERCFTDNGLRDFIKTQPHPEPRPDGDVCEAMHRAARMASDAEEVESSCMVGFPLIRTVYERNSNLLALFQQPSAVCRDCGMRGTAWCFLCRKKIEGADDLDTLYNLSKYLHDVDEAGGGSEDADRE